jgi:hypothetical protein
VPGPHRGSASNTRSKHEGSVQKLAH